MQETLFQRAAFGIAMPAIRRFERPMAAMRKRFVSELARLRRLLIAAMGRSNQAKKTDAIPERTP